jgi:hypothetical protein
MRLPICLIGGGNLRLKCAFEMVVGYIRVNPDGVFCMEGLGDRIP